MFFNTYDSKWISFLKCRVDLNNISYEELYNLYKEYMKYHSHKKEWDNIGYNFSNVIDIFLSSYLDAISDLLISQIKKLDDIDKLESLDLYMNQIYDLYEQKFFEILERLIINIVISKNKVYQDKKDIIDKIREYSIYITQGYSRRFMINTINMGAIIVNYLKGINSYEDLNIFYNFFEYRDPYIFEGVDIVEKNTIELEKEFQKYINSHEELSYIYNVLNNDLYYCKQSILLQN